MIVYDAISVGDIEAKGTTARKVVVRSQGGRRWMILSHTINDEVEVMPRGGRREGAGRPVLYTEPLIRRTVTLPASYIVQLERLGNGNLSEGIRFMLENARTPSSALWFDAMRQLEPQD